MPVGGLLHIFSSACKAVDKAMHLFNRLFGDMKMLEKFVSDREKMQRFASTCVPLRHYADNILRCNIHPMYDKRWNEVAKFGVPMLELRGQIALYWDSGKLGVDSADAGTDNGFKPTAVGEVLQNAFNYVYCTLVTLLKGLCSEFIAWAEFCPCHRHLQAA